MPRLAPLYDAHCHPTDTPSTLGLVGSLRCAGLCAMATREEDQDRVADLARQFPEKVIPCFGFHPWFTHLIYSDEHGDAEDADDGEAGVDDDDGRHTHSQNQESISAANISPGEAKKDAHLRKVLRPEPDDDLVASMHDLVPISRYLSTIESHFRAFPHAMLGEVGLDKAFRIPDPREKRADGSGRGKLSRHHTDTAHQVMVLDRQLDLAARHNRACSLHGVQIHGLLHECITRRWKDGNDGDGERPSARKARREAWHRRQAELAPRTQTNADIDQAEKGPLEFFPESDDAAGDGNNERSYPPRVCLHSFSGAVDMVKTWLSGRKSCPVDLFFSFSQVVNGRYDRWAAVVQAVPEEMLLIESDYHDATLIDAALDKALAFVCEARGWEEAYGRSVLEKNWHRFVYGASWHDHLPKEAYERR